MTEQSHVVIAVVNNKGGVGKTTTAVHLAAALATARRSVLLVDLDSQASASLWCGVGRGELKPSAAECLLHGLPIQKAIRPTAIPRVHLVTGSIDLANVDLALSDMPGRELALTRMLQSVARQYDIVILDCPPSLSLMGINALVAADAFIVPVTPDYLAVEGLLSLFESMDKVRARIGMKGKLLGIVLTRVASGNAAAHDTIAHVRGQYRGRVFHTEIPASHLLEEVPATATTVFAAAPKSKAADAYQRLAGEVLERLRH